MFSGLAGLLLPLERPVLHTLYIPRRMPHRVLKPVVPRSYVTGSSEGVIANAPLASRYPEIPAECPSQTIYISFPTNIYVSMYIYMWTDR